MSSNPRRSGIHSYDLSRPSGRNYSISWGDTPSSVAPYVPSPLNIVKKMLELAGAGADDVVYDLGCGDGRILFTAIEEFNVKKAVGYELNPSMCGTIREKINDKGLEKRIEVVNSNFFLADLSSATIITIYLTTSGNTKLKPKLEKELKEGAKVVSHDFPIHGWTTMKPGEPIYFDVSSHRIYLYRVPEAYHFEYAIKRPQEEESRWRRLRDTFLRIDR